MKTLILALILAPLLVRADIGVSGGGATNPNTITLANGKVLVGGTNGKAAAATPAQAGLIASTAGSGTATTLTTGTFLFPTPQGNYFIETDGTELVMGTQQAGTAVYIEGNPTGPFCYFGADNFYLGDPLSENLTVFDKSSGMFYLDGGGSVLVDLSGDIRYNTGGILTDVNGILYDSQGNMIADGDGNNRYGNGATLTGIVTSVVSGTGITVNNTAGVYTVSVSSSGSVLTSGTISANHVLSSGTVPRISVGAGAGTGGTVSIDANSSTDEGGYITVVAGTVPSAGAAIVTGTFATPYTNKPAFVVSMANQNVGAVLITGSASTSTFVIEPAITTGAIGTGTYVISYQAKGKQ